MEITNSRAHQIMANCFRTCPQCKAPMSQLSIRCPNRKCNVETPLIRLNTNAYYEHFEIAECFVHGKGLVYCVHPKLDSKLGELDKTCVICCREFLESELK